MGSFLLVPEHPRNWTQIIVCTSSPFELLKSVRPLMHSQRSHALSAETDAIAAFDALEPGQPLPDFSQVVKITRAQFPISPLFGQIMGICSAKEKKPKRHIPVQVVPLPRPPSPPSPTTVIELRKLQSVPCLAMGTSQMYKRRKQKIRSRADSGAEAITPKTALP